MDRGIYYRLYQEGVQAFLETGISTFIKEYTDNGIPVKHGYE